MATQKQHAYLRDLMIDAGHAHAKGYMRSSSKSLPHGPTMRERGGTVDAWIDRLTPAQASAVIGALAN